MKKIILIALLVTFVLSTADARSKPHRRPVLERAKQRIEFAKRHAACLREQERIQNRYK